VANGQYARCARCDEWSIERWRREVKHAADLVASKEEGFKAKVEVEAKINYLNVMTREMSDRRDDLSYQQ
jgi:hypothetical protein